MPTFLFDNFDGVGFLDDGSDIVGTWSTPDVDFDDADFAHHPGDQGLTTIPLTGNGGIYNTYGGSQALLLMPVKPPSGPDYALDITFSCDPRAVLASVYLALRAKPILSEPWANAYSMAGVRVDVNGDGIIHISTYDTLTDFGGYTTSSGVYDSYAYASGHQRFNVRVEVQGMIRTIKFQGVVVSVDELTDPAFVSKGTVAIAVVTSDPSFILQGASGDNEVQNDVFWTDRVKTTEV